MGASFAATFVFEGGVMSSSKEEAKLPSPPRLYYALTFQTQLKLPTDSYWILVKTLGPRDEVLKGGILLHPVTLYQSVLTNPD